ncbi:class I SAM-dependent methyltransferase [Aliidiomarina shirensis]|uniref:class I SAM-dependent methyltransferase n=1 Tax=Aliidiomarina shirensis TaxID=1048642 RepID=UPI0018E5301E|nr:class I SAM-dependent methyltransferase [Aliidiomarina shirensis]
MSFPVPLLAAEPELQSAAAALAAEFGLPTTDTEADFILELTREGLQLRWRSKPEYQPLILDYTRGAQAWRQQLGGGRQEAVVRALGLGKGFRPKVLDATAGLGRDSLMLGHAGCEVWMLERNPAIHALLHQAVLHLQQFHGDGHWSSQRVHVLPAGSLLDKESLHEEFSKLQPHAVYLDPMFPEREKSAAVKKDMQVLQHLVGADLDADGLLPAALALASCRVVVKRPAKAPFLAGQTPSSQIASKKHRFDVYIKQPYPKVNV